MISTKKTILIISIVFCGVLSARVFRSIKAADTPFKSIQDYSGFSVYAAGANINDSKAELQIFAFKKSFRDTVRTLELLFGDVFGYGGSFGKAEISGDMYVTRLVVINLGRRDQTVVFAIRQSKEEYTKSKLPPVSHILNFLPSYPGAVPVSYLANDETSFMMETSEVYGSAQTVMMFYVNALESQGWIRGIPVQSGRSFPRYMIWIKPGKLCSVYANTNPKGSTTVNIIYKKYMD